MSLAKRSLGWVASAALTLAVAAPASAATANDTTQFTVAPGSLSLSSTPDVPNLGALTLNGQAQTVTGQMSSWTAVDATGSSAGWNLNVQGDATAGRSAVFKDYCTDGTATNGCNTAVGGAAGPGYVTGGAVLPANSLTLGSTSAVFNAVSGTTGTAPTHSCASLCNLDAASPVKIASAAANAGMGTWQGASYAASSVALTTPTSMKSIGSGNKAYRVDLLWTLSTGP